MNRHVPALQKLTLLDLEALDSHLTVELDVVILFSTRAVCEVDLGVVWQNDCKLLTGESDPYLREEERGLIHLFTT